MLWPRALKAAAPEPAAWRGRDSSPRRFIASSQPLTAFSRSLSPSSAHTLCCLGVDAGVFVATRGTNPTGVQAGRLAAASGVREAMLFRLVRAA
eukprot:3273713-Prymnesium_polylepis.2